MIWYVIIIGAISLVAFIHLELRAARKRTERIKKLLEGQQRDRRMYNDMLKIYEKEDSRNN